jgi:hypothetical protein
MGHTAEEKIKILYEDSLADIRELTGRMESFSATVVAAAEKVSNGKSILHGQNEQLLIDQVKKIKEAVGQIVGLENNMSAAIVNQTHTLLQPVLASIEAVARRLNEKDSIAIAALRKTSDTQARWSRTALYIAIGFVLLPLLTGFGGVYVGQVMAGKEITKDEEWLASADGKYARQLRDAGSLKQLATCDPGEDTSGWKIKNMNECIPSPVTTKKGVVVTGWKIKQ